LFRKITRVTALARHQFEKHKESQNWNWLLNNLALGLQNITNSSINLISFIEMTRQGQTTYKWIGKSWQDKDIVLRLEDLEFDEVTVGVSMSSCQTYTYTHPYQHTDSTPMSTLETGSADLEFDEGTKQVSWSAGTLSTTIRIHL